MAAPTDRPPSILSEWGEGYCRWCFFVVGLSHDGRLAQHSRGSNGASPHQCDGSGTKPPKITPYASQKAAFKTVARKMRCHECSREVSVLPDGRFAAHTVAYHVTTSCKGGYSFPRPPERDHGSERG